MADNEIHRCGIMDPNSEKRRRYQINSFVEKTVLDTILSNFVIMGRYVFNSEILRFLEGQKIGADGYIQLTDAVQKLNET